MITALTDRGNLDIEDAMFFANFLANTIHARTCSLDSLRVVHALGGVFDRLSHLDSEFRGDQIFSVDFMRVYCPQDPQEGQELLDTPRKLAPTASK